MSDDGMKAVGVDVEVGGATFSIEFDKICSADAATAAQWGTLAARAAAALDREDARYRAWRAREGEAVAKKDWPEWKVKQRIESLPEFETRREALAKSRFASLAADAVYRSIMATIGGRDGDD